MFSCRLCNMQFLNVERLRTTDLSCPYFHGNSERITLRQAQVDKLYAGLKDLAEERRGRLQERLRLTQLKREVDDLEQWIAEREVVAGSHELGQDYEHVTVSFSFSATSLGDFEALGNLAEQIMFLTFVLIFLSTDA